jgi:hypothetical protein
MASGLLDAMTYRRSSLQSSIIRGRPANTVVARSAKAVRLKSCGDEIIVGRPNIPRPLAAMLNLPSFTVLPFASRR